MPEYVPFFLAFSGHSVAQAVSGLALGTATYAATGSPLLSAVALSGPALAQVLGAATLMSAADRLPPRAALTGLALLCAAGTAVQAAPGTPVWAVLGVLLVLGLAGSVGGGVRYGLLREIVDRDGYLLARSALAVAAGVTQVVGFALGGALVGALTPHGALGVGAVLHLLSAGVTRVVLSRRVPRGVERASVAGTWRANGELWADRRRRAVLLASWVPNGLVVGCESLYVAYDPGHAGALFAAAALGMLVGDTVVGRFVPPHRRARLVVPLCALLAAPHLLLWARPPLPVAVAAVLVATVGYGSGLLLQERLLHLTPPGSSGHALGLQSAGMLTGQGLGAVVAGSVAEATTPATGIVAAAAASLAVTAALARHLRPAA
ncbi:MFS transporter [Pseudonocardia lacus]|uniref:MFS transporter n=1 Tax=Pseudonocardia lacus TaxID=2835865 RepID=UPI0027E37B63|nr:MFS transporter [Pseudonocardia lacus]